MAKITFPYKSDFFTDSDKSIQLVFRILGTFIILFIFIAPISIVEANIFEVTIQELGSKSRSTIKIAVKKLGDHGDPAALPALLALKNKRLAITENERLVILNESESKGRDFFTGDILNVESLVITKPMINNSVRRVLSTAIAKLKLTSDDPVLRLEAAKDLLRRSSSSIIPLVEISLIKEKNDNIKEVLLLVLAKEYLQGDDKKKRIESINTIKNFGSKEFFSVLEELLIKNDEGEFLEKDSEIRRNAAEAIKSVKKRQVFIDQVANLFYGLSLGSILLLAALGLAITFGLMGVINMAHGEMIMIGAYATFVVQNIFIKYLPSLFDWYLIVAIPVSFLASAIVGIVLERSVIRHLYGRPLETLLATWGISLVLIQSVRLIFGAQNVAVENPFYLSGGIEVFSGVIFPYSRIAIIIFVIFIVILIWMLLQKTPLGLQVRAVTQNREMAACMGISTHKVDMWTFGLGSGVAGLGGLALSQIGNVGPELGRMYIVDSFMVVVLGGVGKIAGTVAGAFSIGIVNKILEPFSGAVLGKIIVLVLIIALIQKRPQGLFAPKGRNTED
ncbi:MAG: urea ABC transporter permease subunit UrtB [Nitrospinaceae bacterium]